MKNALNAKASTHSASVTIGNITKASVRNSREITVALESDPDDSSVSLAA
jgi:hypothetical protein